MVLRYDNEQYKYHSHHDSMFERELFLELTLGKGVYTFIPYSTGIGLKFQNLNIEMFDEYSIQNPVIRYLFNKNIRNLAFLNSKLDLQMN